MSTWQATTLAQSLGVGTSLKLSPVKDGALPQVDDTVGIDGADFTAGSGRIASVKEDEVEVELETGARYKFARRRNPDRATRGVNDASEDWVVQAVVPVATS